MSWLLTAFLESEARKIRIVRRRSALDALVGWLATPLDLDQGKYFKTLFPAPEGGIC